MAIVEPWMKGMNLSLFVHTEEIPAAIKRYRDFQKEKKLEDNDFTGAVFEGKFYGPDEFKKLESLPSRAEVYAKLLGSLQSPASALKHISSEVPATARQKLDMKCGNEHGYRAEGTNQSRLKGMKRVKVPNMCWDHTRTTVLTMEWVDGIKLTYETRLKNASLNKTELIDQSHSSYCSRE